MTIHSSKNIDFELWPEKNENNNHVCAFCKMTSHDESIVNGHVYIDRKMVGPFFDHDRHIYFYAHKRCALWCPQVYYKHGRLKNIELELSRSRFLNCASCRRNGAALGCCVEECNKSYHIICAFIDHCFINKKSYKIWCPQHFLQLTLKNQNYISWENSFNKVNINLSRPYTSALSIWSKIFLNQKKRKIPLINDKERKTPRKNNRKILGKLY